ncbi:unnamed protein product [Pleuronectes platessa]|uniref:Uncharacterized protein n=1 Tax=Pleuronectes platessa TaxID=8262 RepID=A0A9N7Z1T5_PLEPL|nr:unnamed protein product [Pleuronectes platessa]
MNLHLHRDEVERCTGEEASIFLPHEPLKIKPGLSPPLLWRGVRKQCSNVWQSTVLLRFTSRSRGFDAGRSYMEAK